MAGLLVTALVHLTKELDVIGSSVHEDLQAHHLHGGGKDWSGEEAVFTQRRRTIWLMKATKIVVTSREIWRPLS
jgi:hypothetical protein